MNPAPTKDADDRRGGIHAALRFCKPALTGDQWSPLREKCVAPPPPVILLFFDCFHPIAFDTAISACYGRITEISICTGRLSRCVWEGTEPLT